MSDQKQPDKTRRNLLVATSVVGGAATAGAAVPFVAGGARPARPRPDRGRHI
jgi:hypothetical protein